MLVVLTGVAGNAYLVRFWLIGDLGLAIASFAGCVVVLAILSAVSTRVSVVTLLLVGLMLGYLCVGLINVSLHFIDENHAKAFKAWDDASFAGATWRQLTILCPGDLVTHLPLEHHIFHLNAVIGLVGAPVALFVLLRSRALRSWEAH